MLPLYAQCVESVAGGRRKAEKEDGGLAKENERKGENLYYYSGTSELLVAKGHFKENKLNHSNYFTVLVQITISEDLLYQI